MGETGKQARQLNEKWKEVYRAEKKRGEGEEKRAESSLVLLWEDFFFAVGHTILGL